MLGVSKSNGTHTMVWDTGIDDKGPGYKEKFQEAIRTERHDY